MIFGELGEAIDPGLFEKQLVVQQILQIQGYNTGVQFLNMLQTDPSCFLWTQGNNRRPLIIRAEPTLCKVNRRPQICQTSSNRLQSLLLQIFNCFLHLENNHGTS
jgi:hypothetical protein